MVVYQNGSCFVALIISIWGDIHRANHMSLNVSTFLLTKGLLPPFPPCCSTVKTILMDCWMDLSNWKSLPHLSQSRQLFIRPLPVPLDCMDFFVFQCWTMQHLQCLHLASRIFKPQLPSQPPKRTLEATTRRLLKGRATLVTQLGLLVCLGHLQSFFAYELRMIVARLGVR